jgi:hypothetical protein
LKRVPLEEGETARVTVQPSRRHDAGGGRGKAVERDVSGGCCGLILDTRGRPLPFAADPVLNTAARRADYLALELPVPEGEASNSAAARKEG